MAGQREAALVPLSVTVMKYSNKSNSGEEVFISAYSSRLWCPIDREAAEAGA